MRHALGLLLGTVLFAAGCVSPRVSVVPELGTFETDAVELIERGEAVEGSARLSLVHEHFRYRFASPATLEAFASDPARYEIQLGGACGRMGALSGIGRTDIYSVHEGRLYIFASEQCRDTFLRAPRLVLEPEGDDPPVPTAAQAARGRELLALTVAWMGGAEALGSLRSLEYRTEADVVWEDRVHRQVDRRVVGLPDRMRTEHIWDDRSSMRVISPGGAYFIDHETGARAMHPQQRAAMRRLLNRNVAGLLQRRDEAGVVVAALGRREGSPGETVAVHLDGTTTELIIDPETGRLAGTRHTGWGPGMLLAELERRFVGYDRVAGLRLPATWETWVEGRHFPELDRREATPVRANVTLTDQEFSRDARPAIGG